MAVRQVPREKTPEHSWQVDYSGPLPVAPGGYEGVLTEIDTYFTLGFASPVVDANAQNTIKGVEQKILYRSGPRNELHFFRPRNTLYNP